MDESLQKSGSWVASFGGVFSPGAEILELNILNSVRSCAKNVAKRGKLIL